MKKIIILALLIFSLSFAGSPAASEKENTEATTKAVVYIRATPGGKGKIIGALPDGFTYKVTSSYGSYAYVRVVDAKTKQVHHGYLWTKAIVDTKGIANMIVSFSLSPRFVEFIREFSPLSLPRILYLLLALLGQGI